MYEIVKLGQKVGRNKWNEESSKESWKHFDEMLHLHPYMEAAGFHSLCWHKM